MAAPSCGPRVVTARVTPRPPAVVPALSGRGPRRRRDVDVLLPVESVGFLVARSNRETLQTRARCQARYAAHPHEISIRHAYTPAEMRRCMRRAQVAGEAARRAALQRARVVVGRAAAQRVPLRWHQPALLRGMVLEGGGRRGLGPPAPRVPPAYVGWLRAALADCGARRANQLAAAGISHSVAAAATAAAAPTASCASRRHCMHFRSGGRCGGAPAPCAHLRPARRKAASRLVPCFCRRLTPSRLAAAA